VSSFPSYLLFVKTSNARLRQEQAGFRRGRGTIEQIFLLRNISEQVIEWNANLYVCFVDFEKAFDSILTVFYGK